MPLYSYAVKGKDEPVYKMITDTNLCVRIPIFGTMDKATNDFMKSEGNRELEHIIVDIKPLVEAGVIKRSKLSFPEHMKSRNS